MDMSKKQETYPVGYKGLVVFMDIENIPEPLRQGREMLECNFIFTLYVETSLIEDFHQVTNGEDIITEDGIFYYGILTEMYKNGFLDINDMSITAYLEDKPTLKKGYETRGGWTTIQDIINVISVDNIGAYYDELVKHNMLIRMHQRGFNVLTNLEKFTSMTSDEVYDFFEYQLADVSVGRVEKIEAADLSEGYCGWIDKWDKQPEVGFKIGIKMLNYMTLGIHKKNLTLHVGGIGGGKTTTTVNWYVLPSLENGDNVCIIANEQDESEWRQMILATVLFNKIQGDHKGLTRHKILAGGFTQEQKQLMYQAAEWLESQPGKLTFIDVNDYSVTKMRKLITKYSKKGIAFFIVDTMKPVNDASERAWGEFSEVAKELFRLAKSQEVAILATAQMAPEAMSRKYLDLTCVGKAKSISETATMDIMFRKVGVEEKEKIECYKWNSETQTKDLFKLDPEKDYIMIFVPKNRFGKTDPQIVCERNLDFNTYKEIGWYECPYDSYKTR